jgi:hypothetical protein
MIEKQKHLFSSSTHYSDIDEFVKSLKIPLSVIPAPIFIGVNSSRNPVISNN